MALGLADLDDDVAELLERAEPAERDERLLKGLTLQGGRPAGLSDRRIQVLVADGLGHVRGCQIEGRHLVGSSQARML